jgi:hypothetical protein
MRKRIVDEDIDDDLDADNDIWNPHVNDNRNRRFIEAMKLTIAPKSPRIFTLPSRT